MYNHLRGTLIENRINRLIVETGGVGYAINVPLSTSQRAPKPGAEIIVFTHLVVREDALLLYGFLTEEERALFRVLIGLSGVGPSLATQVLSAVSPRDFALAIERQDVTMLKKIKGVGAKKASQIMVGLKGAKMLLSPDEDAGPALVGVAGDAVAALEAMGVPQREAIARVEKVMAGKSGLALEDVVRQALQ
jgi:Holliday junction DNA helicase RuvA